MLVDSLAAIGPPAEADEISRFMGPMSDYPHLAYSMKAVRRAGERLSGNIPFGPDISKAQYEDAVEVFAVANSWRNSHIYPMRSVRFSVGHHMRAQQLKGDMASRPKRMSSIRRKLRETTNNYDQMNDLGGCRAIMADSNGVRALLTAIRDKFPHTIRQEYPLIDRPKADGYRSHHIVFTFVPRSADTEAFAGRRVELQVRTRLQHSWATAVEAVDLYTGQDLKHGKGNHDWLRLFALASAEFARVENCPAHPDVPGHDETVRELRDLNQKLHAAETLENIKNATLFAENYQFDRGRYYLIRYKADHTVSVEAYDSTIVAAEELDQAEARVESGKADEKVVLVEVDKIDKLVQTYPNYFGDVSLFVSNLQRICIGKQAVEYSMAPQQIVRPPRPENPNFAALYRRYTRWLHRG